MNAPRNFSQPASQPFRARANKAVFNFTVAGRCPS